MRKLSKKELQILQTAHDILEDAFKDEIETCYNLNVHRLTRDCLKEVILGNGRKTIFITSDDEANEYHRLLYTINTSPNELNSLKEENPCMEDCKDEDIALLG